MFVLMTVAAASMIAGMIVTVSIHRRMSANAFWGGIFRGRLFRGPFERPRDIPDGSQGRVSRRQLP